MSIYLKTCCSWCCSIVLCLPLQAAELLLSGSGELVFNSSSATPGWQRPWFALAVPSA